MKTLSCFIFGVLLVLVLVEPAQAYIDPGTGSMLVQGMLAVIAAVSVTVGVFWKRLRSFFGGLFCRKNRAAEGDGSDGI